jgi:Peptidase family M48
MNFFEQQDQARRRTVWLVLLFILAIVCVALSFYALALIVIVPQAQERGAQGAQIWWNTEIFLQITGAVCLIIFLGAGVQRLRLGSSGKSVAEALGGQLLQGATNNADEQKLRDVVDEMAIASGMPVPPIYILQEDAINAFAAGSNPQDAVLGFTRGAITQLNREELQGVTGHEFSHIAHKDTRLNLRIACVVAGVMLIALIGRVMLQVAGRIATVPNMSSKKDNLWTTSSSGREPSTRVSCGRISGAIFQKSRGYCWRASPYWWIAFHAHSIANRVRSESFLFFNANSLVAFHASPACGACATH